MQLALLALTLASLALAHPGEDHAAAAAAHAAALGTLSHRSLSHCAEQLHARSLARRAALLAHARTRRDAASVLGTDHRSNLTVSAATNASTLFGAEHACVLAPDVTVGPYYVTGELLRANMTESQAGVPLLLDIQVIDTATCSPAAGVALDLWHCNATGVYSGVVARGNGDSGDSRNADATFLRGIQPTDSSGVARMATIVPGHYAGRAPHIHVLAHAAGAWAAANGSISGGDVAAHTGQIYFDQALLDAVYALAPYAANTAQLTTNAEDRLLAQGAEGADPVVEYALLGDSVADGVLAWITLGIDTGKSSRVQVAATHAAQGASSGAAGATAGAGASSGASAAASPSALPSPASLVLAALVAALPFAMVRVAGL